jgi:signal transduction histidine kinase
VPEASKGYVAHVEPATTAFARGSRWFREVDPWMLDAVLGTVFTVVSLVGILADGSRDGLRDPDALGVVLALGAGVPFYFRRRAPLASLLVSTVSVTLLFTLDFPAQVQSQLMIVAAYSLGAHATGVERVVGFVALEAGVVVVAAVGTPDADTENILFAGALYAAAYFFGSAMRNRRLFIEQLEAREALLARERDEEAQRAIADERLRIAQELHDVVAHSMGVIAVQAGVGAHVIDDDPAEAKRSLEAISTTSRGSLAEIRRLLDALRADGDAGYEPAPGLADVERLVADLTAAGLDVTLRIDGTRGDLPPGVDLTAFRIVQEALTNVLKHAGQAHACVTIGYEPGALRLEITDEGRGVDGRPSEGGHGLIGMRERVSVYAGTLDAGPAVGGGYRVVARLPYGSTE